MKSKSAPKNKARPPLEQLQSSMSPALRNKHFNVVKNHILQLGLEKLDIKLNTRDQQDIMTDIETEIADKYPNVFHGPHSAVRLQYARQAVVRQHCGRRTKLGFTKRRTQKAEKENVKVVDQSNNYILDLTMLEDSDEESKPYSFPGTSQRKNIPYQEKKREVTLEPRIRSRWTYSTSTSQAGDSSILSSVSEQKPAKVPKASASHPSASSSSQVYMGIKGLNHIHDFLKSCSPSLGHFLSRFVDLGFKSVETLNEVACNWTGEERREVLKKLRVPNGGEISELELVVLERRFQKYYLEILNGM